MSVPTKNWWKMAEIYKLFVDVFNADFSSRAAQALFDYESRGDGFIQLDTFIDTNNGYAIGKKWCDVNIAMWLKALEKPGWYWELKSIYSDRRYPRWWLNKIFKNFLAGKKEFFDTPERLKRWDKMMEAFV